ncbi:MAG: MFS transporter, partial [Firmicutes bacterium]|nr:MFS transporter [Bacillota bacterium]
MTTYTDKQLTQRFSFLHFAFFAEYSGCGFISFLLMQKTISTAMIGVIAALTYLASALIQPVWGILCDRYSCHRVFYWIGGLAGPLIYLAICLSDSLWVLILCGLLSGMFLQALQNMSTGWIAGLNNAGYNIIYGKTRSFGSLAFALASLVYGRAVLFFGNNAIPAIMAVLGLVAVYASCRLPKVSDAAKAAESISAGAAEEKNGISLSEGIRILLKQRDYVFFVSACFLAIMGFAGTST